MALISYKLILISKDLQRLNEIAIKIESTSTSDEATADARFLRNLANLAERIHTA